MCWDHGQNPDLPYLKAAMKEIHKQSVIDFDNGVFLGFSAGSQMVSAALSIFPTLIFTDHANNNIGFPYPKAAFMISGGSQFCYAYDFSRGDYQDAPPPFQPCDPPPDDCGGKGGCAWDCCPVNSTEKAYMNGTFSYANHPPVVLFQTEDDNNASPLASKRYYETAVKEGFPAARIVGKGYHHGLITEQGPLFARLLHYYLCPLCNQQRIRNQSTDIPSDTDV